MPGFAFSVRSRRAWLGACLAVICALAAGCGQSDARRRVVLATTTSVEDTGLLDVLIPMFAEAWPQYDVQYVAVGSGQALELGRRRDADVLITHSPADEDRFMSEGHGIDRRPLMHNTFVLAGPPLDSAGVRGVHDIAEAFRRIASTGQRFVSRGDDSGTHRKEREIWSAAGIEPAGDWYLEAGVGMADALRIASERRAYILTDNATWLFSRAALELESLSSSDPRLINRYVVIRVANALNPEGAEAFANWIVSAEVLRVIGEFKREELGEALFIPEAAH
jgi:tungstate transport system substrate-binding protein